MYLSVDNLKLKIVVVLFEKRFDSSKTLVSLLMQDYSESISPSLCIYDNSSVKQLTNIDLKELNKKFIVEYLHTPENKSLAAIYEDNFSKERHAHFFLLLDDDSQLPVNYLDVFYKEYNAHISENVFVPVVKVKNKIYSPYTEFFVLSRAVSEMSKGASDRNLTAINSGVFIKRELVETFHYPDYAQFYGTDTVLFEYIRKTKNAVHILPVDIDHDVSFHPEAEMEVYLRSLKQVTKFWNEHYVGKGITYRIFLYSYLIYLSFKNSLKTKSFINLFSYL